MCNTDWKYKRQAMTAAKQLGYGDAVILRVKASNSVIEIDRIMRTARLNMPWRQEVKANGKGTGSSNILHVRRSTEIDPQRGCTETELTLTEINAKGSGCCDHCSNHSDKRDCSNRICHDVGSVSDLYKREMDVGIIFA